MVKKPTYEDLEQRIKEFEKEAGKHNKVKEALWDSRNMLQTILDSIPSAVFWKDRDSIYLGGSRAWLEAVGLKSSEEVVGKRDYDLPWEKEQADKFREDDMRVMESGIPEYDIIEPYLRADGIRAWARTNKAPLRDTKGNVIGVLGTYEDITERKQAEKKIRDSEERLNLALKGGDLGTWDWNLKTSEVQFNKRWAEMKGYALDEIKPHLSTWEKLVHPEDLPGVYDILNAHLEGKTPFYEAEFRMRHKSGEWLWIMDRGKVVEWDAGGRPIRASGTHLDITERKRAEEEMVLSRARFEAIFNSITDGAIFTDTDRRIVTVNPAFTRMFGYELDEVRGRNAESLYVNKADYEDQGMRRYHVNGETEQRPFEIRYRRKDGTLFDAETLGVQVKDVQGNVIGYSGIHRDITERKQAEEALKQSKARLELATAATNIGHWDWDLLTNEVYFSPLLKRQLGYEDHEIPNRPKEWKTWLHPDDHDRAMKALRDYIEGRSPEYAAEFRLRHKDGSYRWIYTQADKHLDENGKACRLFGCHIDLTERKKMETQLRKEHEQRKILSKRLIDLLERDRQQTAMELHDHIGQKLTSLKMDLEKISNEVTPTGAGLDIKIKAASYKVAEAIRDIKNAAYDLRPSILDALGLVPSLRELFNDIRMRTDMEIHFFYRGIPKDLEKEKKIALYRIAQEAVNNVVKHARAKNVHVNLSEREGVIFLGIEDDGVGFDKDKAMKATKRKGPLGLHIMQERAMQLSGEFAIESQPGKGTHVMVEIPV